MTNMKVFLELVADSRRMKDGMKQGERAMSGFTHKAKAEMASLRNAVGSLQGRLAGLGVSIGAGALMWQSANLDKSLTQIGQTAGATALQVRQLRGDLFRLGKDSGQDVDNLKEGFNVLVQSGLNMKEAKATLEGVNTAMAVTGSEARTLAGGLTVASTAFQFDLAKPGLALELLDKMTVAGRLGKAELENLSDIFARVGVNAASAGMNFDATLAFVEALSQIEREPEKLATLADSTLRVFTNLRYMAEAQKATGVRFFDAEGQRRDAMAVLEDIRKKYKTLTTDAQRAEFVQKAFGKADLDTIKGFRTLLSGNSLDDVRRFSQEIGQAGGTLKRDMKDATANLVDQAGRLKASLREAADGFAAPVNKALADLIAWSMAGKKDGGLGLSGKEMLGYGAGISIATMLAGRYGGKAIGGFLKKRAGTAAGIAEGKAVQAATGVTPVFVTNWPGGFGGAALEAAGAGAVARTGLGTLKKLGGNALKFAPAAGVWGLGAGTSALAGYGIGNLLNRGLGWLSGKASGGKYKGEGWLGDMLYSLVHKEKKQENKINLSIRVDQYGRVITNSNDMNTTLNVSMARGAF